MPTSDIPHEARAELCKLLGREPAIRERPWPLALRKHVGFAHQAFQPVEVLRLAQIEPADNLPWPVSYSWSSRAAMCGAVIFKTSAPCSAKVRHRSARRAPGKIFACVK